MPPFSGYDTRLPTPGGDNNVWGYILENFLAVSFNYAATSGGVNGTLNTSVSANQATTGQPGFVQLAGDLAGTAVSPTVVSAHLSSPLPVNQGGSGAASLPANAALLGNGTGAVQSVAAGNAGNVLTDNGTTWVSQAASTGTQRTFAFFAG